MFLNQIKILTLNLLEVQKLLAYSTVLYLKIRLKNRHTLLMLYSCRTSFNKHNSRLFNKSNLNLNQSQWPQCHKCPRSRYNNGRFLPLNLPMFQYNSYQSKWQRDSNYKSRTRVSCSSATILLAGRDRLQQTTKTWIYNTSSLIHIQIPMFLLLHHSINNVKISASGIQKFISECTIELA